MKKALSIVIISAIAATTALTITACGSSSDAQPTTAPTTVAATTAAPTTAAPQESNAQSEVSAADNAQSQDNANNDSSSADSYSGSDTNYNSVSDSDDNAVEDSEWRSEEGNAMSKNVATQTLMDYSKEEYPGSTAVSRGCMSFYDEDKQMYGYRVNLDITTAEGNLVSHGFLIYDDGSITVEY